MMMAQNATDGKLEKLLGAATDLFDYVQQAAEDGKAVHEVEEGIWHRMLQMGHEALGQFLERQGDGDLGETLTMPNGHEVKRLEQPHLRCYQSIFGEFPLQRAVYGVRRTRNRVGSVGRSPAIAGKRILLRVAGLGSGIGHGTGVCSDGGGVAHDPRAESAGR